MKEASKLLSVGAVFFSHYSSPSLGLCHSVCCNGFVDLFQTQISVQRKARNGKPNEDGVCAERNEWRRAIKVVCCWRVFQTGVWMSSVSVSRNPFSCAVVERCVCVCVSIYLSFKINQPLIVSLFPEAGPYHPYISARVRSETSSPWDDGDSGFSFPEGVN